MDTMYKYWPVSWIMMMFILNVPVIRPSNIVIQTLTTEQISNHGGATVLPNLLSCVLEAVVSDQSTVST